MKRVLLLLLIAASFSAEAQPFNNEWIDYNKTYYKFKIAKDGVYRIRQSTLNSIGLGSVNADHFQLWRNGQQVPIYTTIQGAPFSTNDYIEFWGEMNDGKPDHPMYRDPDYMITDKWSLQTDTAAYFLTVNPVGGNFRLQTTINDITNPPAPDPFFMYTEGKYYKEKIHSGRAELVGDSYTYSSSYDNGEGWSTNDIGTGGVVTYFTNAMYPYTGPGAPDPVMTLHTAGNAPKARNIKVMLNGDSIMAEPCNFFDIARISKTLTPAQINGAVMVQFMNLCAEPNDRVVIAQNEFRYARTFNFGNQYNFVFELPASATGNYLEITNFNHFGVAPVLFDLNNGKRYVANISTPTIVKVRLEPSAGTRKLVLLAVIPGNVTEIQAQNIQTRNFENYGLAANQGNYLIITSPFLTTPSTPGNPVEDYRLYRSSSQGGGFNAKVYMIDQLVDQFGLGIRMHPLSIRNFVRWARANYSSPLQYVLIIGKGVIYPQFRQEETVGIPDMYKLALVPTFGYPASDNLLMAEGGSSVPLTPVGRISAINKSEITAYLDKVKEFEQLEATGSTPSINDMSWRKNVIHVTGASDDEQTTILQTANEGFRKIIEDTLFGGKVYSFTKSSSEAVQQLSSGLLGSLFSHGIGLLTYFGHSSASTLEFNLDNPQNYNNQGKYPIMIVMGCNAGNFFTYNNARFATKETISEKYILASNRGAIAFLASTHLGIVHYLDVYNTRLYQAISIRKYGETIGHQMRDAIDRVFVGGNENDFYARFQCEQFSLHGDPALRIYNVPKPDYVIEDQLVQSAPSFISMDMSDFKLKVGYMNIGQSPNKPIVITLKRVFPDLTYTIRRDTIPYVRYMDSIIYTIPIASSRDKGLNKFTITIDADNEVDEQFETNNSITKDIYIFEDEVRPVYPYNYSIVNDQNTKYVASTANSFAEVRNYLMEMDTTELFNSPLKIATSLTSAGGVLEFNVNMPFVDSTVYYWRVAPANPVGEPTWNVASFTYINGNVKGYSQGHLYQHLKSERDRISLDSFSRRWEFVDKANFIFLRNGVYPSTSGDAAYYTGTINDQEGLIMPGCNYDELMITVVDPVTFKPWVNKYGAAPWAPLGNYNSWGNCPAGRAHNFQYLLGDTTWRGRAMRFLENIVPDGHIVIIRSNTSPNLGGNTYSSVWKADEAQWGPGISLYHTLKNQGFAGIDSFNQPRSFVFIYRKNAQSEFTPYWSVSDNTFDGITGSATFHAPDSLGYITSPAFGPAKAWYEMKWKGRSEDVNDNIDEPTVNIIGISNTGSQTVLFENIIPSQESVDISSVDVTQYPFLKLQMRNVDTLYHTAWQLKYWMLTYDPVPEGAIAPNLYFTTKDSVEIGEPLNFGIGFKNVSHLPFDSIKVKLTITDKNNVANIVPIPKQKDLAPEDTIKLNVPIDTRSLSGPHILFVNFNPDFDQPEQYLTNNYAFRNLYVKPDSLNPLMDVTFDGVHILNRDIISAKPEILIKLRDEQRFMRLDSAELMVLDVKYPNGDMRRFDLRANNDTVRFIPASPGPGLGNNVASIEFNPFFEQDGEYEMIVSGKDKAGNNAGAVQYRIAFQVINKPMISNMLNYPNPFTTSTAFVFTLTGSQVPQNIRIQILTITGKIVREITKEELGPLRIGRNITEFKWDGTDQYGDKLANGVYLYRVITNLNGKSLDKYRATNENTDKFFNNGYGKMYLMR